MRSLRCSSYLLLIAVIDIALFAKTIDTSNYCRENLQNQELKQIKWSYLRECLLKVSSEIMSPNINQNIWRLVKLAFDSIDAIPPEAYRSMGYSLTEIPLEDLRNISMENVDMIEVFGSISNSRTLQEYQKGFNAEQLNLLAQKVRQEWLGKNPQTYSEYDLTVMGEILCYLNVTDIANIHTDAFMEVAEWIGLIENCPEDRLKALAKLARRPDAFGEPRKWSKLEVSIIGNIINGLSAQEINTIAKDKLQLNHFYKSRRQQTQQSTNKTRSNSKKPLGIGNNSMTAPPPQMENSRELKNSNENH